MKKQIKTIVLAFAAVAGQAQAQSSTAAGDAKVVLHMNTGENVEYSLSKLDSISFVEDKAVAVEEHEWVDLGLPSGTLWATRNIGASKPEEMGDRFAWAEIEPKEEYGWNTYIYYYEEGDNHGLTKYCTSRYLGYNGFTDNLTELQPEDDAATANWGSEWQTPSRKQIEELLEYCTKEWILVDDVYGFKITCKSNGNSIFLPADRKITELNEMGLYNVLHRDSGYYWTRSLSSDSNRSYYLYFHYSQSIGDRSMKLDYDRNDHNRSRGDCIRPIRVQTR